MHVCRHVQIDVNAINVCVQVHVYMFMLRPELDIRSIIQLLSSSFIERCLSLEPEINNPISLVS